MMYSPQTSNLPLTGSRHANGGVSGESRAAADQLIRPLVRLRLEPARIGIGRGVIVADILLRNQSAIPAHRPFLCLPWIGLKLAPARGWKIEEMTSVRRLRRFQRFSDEPIEPGAETSCGSLSFPYRTGNGGHIEYAPGSGHPLASLPDFRIGCTCGAGNFSTIRTDLVIDAECFRNIMASHQPKGRMPP